MPEGLEAIIFTADGDMRQALNNLQARYQTLHTHVLSSFVRRCGRCCCRRGSWCTVLVLGFRV